MHRFNKMKKEMTVINLARALSRETVTPEVIKLR